MAALDELPLRARVGYICKYGRVAQGELTPGVVLGILSAKGALDDVSDLEGARSVAAEVIAYQRGDGDE